MRHLHSRLALTTSLAGILLLSAILPAAGAGSVRHPKKHPVPPVDIQIDGLGPVGPMLAPGFLGLSVEARVLTSNQTDSSRGNLVTLLRSLGPGVLRLGGASVDTQFFQDPASASPPDWATSVVTPEDLDRLASLARDTGWHVILGVGLAHKDAQQAAREASAANSRLGAALMAVEVGNEPSLYPVDQFRPQDWGAWDYQQEFLEYKNAIEAAVPGLPVVGPADSASYLPGVDPGTDVPGAFMTQHLYPASNCLNGQAAGEATATSPTANQLLGKTTAATQQRQLLAGLAVAGANGLPLRVSESNNVICSGVPGVSDTMASALWAADYLTQAASLGVAGVNLHGGFAECTYPASPFYTPLCAAGTDSLQANVFSARPEWYGIQLARLLAGQPFIRTTKHDTANVVVRATRDDAGIIRVLVIDKQLTGSRGLAVRLHLPGGYDQARVMRLTAPSVSATAGITLGGAQVDAQGQINPQSTETVTGAFGVSTITMPASSAALLTYVPGCTVPRVTGLTLGQARQTLESAGCSSGIIAVPRGDRARTALVVGRQVLFAGRHYRYHQPVHLVLRPKPPAKKKHAA